VVSRAVLAASTSSSAACPYVVLIAEPILNPCGPNSFDVRIYYFRDGRLVRVVMYVDVRACDFMVDTCIHVYVCMYGLLV
jgi:hypothetical protein